MSSKIELKKEKNDKSSKEYSVNLTRCGNPTPSHRLRKSKVSEFNDRELNLRLQHKIDQIKEDRVAPKKQPVKVAPKTAIEKLICAKDWDCATAIAIAKAESGLRCEAVGDGHIAFIKNGIEYGKSYGVFQIRHLEGRPAPADLLNCEYNINYAYGLYKARGWKPWSAYNSGAYKKHL